MNWWNQQSGIIKGSIITFAGIVALLIIISVAFSGGGSDKAGTVAPATTAAAKSNIFLVASRSFCVPTGVDDAYTGDGHVTFFLTFRNTGQSGGSASAVPVRHYDDGNSNESALDEVEAPVPAGTTKRFRTSAMTYKAHSHEITGCGVIIDGRGEVAIAVNS